MENLYALNISIRYDNVLRFFHYLILRDGLHTNIHRSKYAGVSENCQFCNLTRESSIHLFWDCHLVIDFRHRVNSRISNEFNFLKLIPNTAKDRILGYRFKEADNFSFIFYTYLNRYIWITKLKEFNLSFDAFKNYLNKNLIIQKKAKSLTCLEHLNISNIWNVIN